MARQIRQVYELKDKASEKMRQATQKITGNLDKIEKKGAAVGKALEKGFKYGAAAAAAGGVAFAVYSKKIIDYGDQLHKLNLRLGISVKELDKLRQVAELSGVSFSTLTMGLQRMTRRVAEAATGTGEAVNALDELGLSAEKLSKLKPEEQFRILSKRIMETSSSADRVRIAMKLFDSEGVALLQMMKDLDIQMQKTNSNFSQEKVNQMAHFNDQLTELEESFMQISITILDEVMPALNKFVEWFTRSKLEKKIDETTAKIANLKEQIGKATGLGKYAVDEWKAELKKQEAYLRFLERSAEIEAIARGRRTDHPDVSGKTKSGSTETVGDDNDEFAREIERRRKLNIEYWDALAASYDIYKRDPEMARVEGAEGAHTTKSAMGALVKVNGKYVTRASLPEKKNTPQGNLDDFMAQRELDWMIEKATLTEQVFDNLYDSISYGMTDAIFDWVDGISSAEDAFKQFAASFLRDMARMITQQLIFNSISSIFGGGSYQGGTVNLASMIGGLFGAAEGGITTGKFQPITAFADGGLATKPTLGMVAEAGESEAIIPLSKLPEVIGSVSTGTSVSLTVNNQGQGQMSDEQAMRMYSQIKRDLSSLMSKTIADKQRPGGQLNRYESRMN